MEQMENGLKRKYRMRLLGSVWHLCSYLKSYLCIYCKTALYSLAQFMRGRTWEQLNWEILE